jgi:predicted acylesterase/phospholipase RssA
MQSAIRSLRTGIPGLPGLSASLAVNNTLTSRSEAQSTTSHNMQLALAMRRPSLFDELRPLREKAGVLQPLNPALALLKRRHTENSTPTTRTDGFKLGLVVEGGGMRGVISGAMLMGLLTLDLRNCFDAVYGASAGAINATFFLSGQPHGLDIYTEDLTDGKFIDLSTLLLPKSLRYYTSPIKNASRLSAMDLHHVLSVMRSVRPLCWNSVINSPVPLKIVVSSLDAMEPVILDNFTDENDLAECLAASATVPEVAGPPRLVRGHRCVDAAVFEPVPVASAIRDGCTHILVLSTRTSASFAPSSVVGGFTQSIAEDIVTRTLLDGRDSYMREAWAKSKTFRSMDKMIHDALNSTDPDITYRKLGAHVLPIHPRTTAGVHPLCTDRAKLTNARAEGFVAIEEDVGMKMGLAMRPKIDLDAWYHWMQQNARQNDFEP